MAIIFDFYCRASHMLQSFNSVCNPQIWYSYIQQWSAYDHDVTQHSVKNINLLCSPMYNILEKIKFTEALTAGLTDPAQATPWVALTNLFFRLLLPLEAVHSLTIIFCQHTQQSIHFIKQSWYRSTFMDCILQWILLKHFVSRNWPFHWYRPLLWPVRINLSVKSIRGNQSSLHL